MFFSVSCALIINAVVLLFITERSLCGMTKTKLWCQWHHNFVFVSSVPTWLAVDGAVARTQFYRCFVWREYTVAGTTVVWSNVQCKDLFVKLFPLRRGFRDIHLSACFLVSNVILMYFLKISYLFTADIKEPEDIVKHLKVKHFYLFFIYQ